jgi:1-acyl-sn-glycerol-3-phosphate acyltransferase
VPFAISAVFQREIHWIMTDTWTFPDWAFSSYLARLSKVILRRIASTYGFSSMPPMPPKANLILNRARSVRSVFNFVKRTKNPVIGLAPEGRDSPDGKLQLPPPGTGRFIAHLAKFGLDIIPVGAFEASDRLCLDFGAPHRLNLPEGYSPDEIDHHVRQLIMSKIADQQPHI